MHTQVGPKEFLEVSRYPLWQMHWVWAEDCIWSVIEFAGHWLAGEDPEHQKWNGHGAQDPVAFIKKPGEHTQSLAASEPAGETELG